MVGARLSSAKNTNVVDACVLGKLIPNEASEMENKKGRFGIINIRAEYIITATRCREGERNVCNK